MSLLDTLWGQGERLTVIQMSVRAMVVFIITLILIRVGGVRIFKNRSAFDTIIMITMGSVLARTIVGVSPFFPTIAAATVMIIIHRMLAWICVRSPRLESVIKGKCRVLYKDGKVMHGNLEKAALSETDLLESLHLETKERSFDEVEEALIETNGRISFIMKKPAKN
jgi:uncharacterized membrane protein YcaP (DUF421 family)